MSQTQTNAAKIAELLATHRTESDSAAKPLAEALRTYGDISQETGTPGLDYTALINFDGETWLVEDNNAWTRIYDPADADYDVAAVLGDGCFRDDSLPL